MIRQDYAIFMDMQASRNVLQCVDEVWPLVAQPVDLFFSLAMSPVVSLAGSAQSILSSQERILQDAAAKQEESPRRHISQAIEVSQG